MGDGTFYLNQDLAMQSVVYDTGKIAFALFFDPEVSSYDQGVVLTAVTNAIWGKTMTAAITSMILQAATDLGKPQSGVVEGHIVLVGVRTDTNPGCFIILIFPGTVIEYSGV